MASSRMARRSGPVVLSSGERLADRDDQLSEAGVGGFGLHEIEYLVPGPVQRANAG